MLLLATVNPLETGERVQVMFERGPQTAVAAIFVVLFVLTAWRLLVSQHEHRVTLEKTGKEHSEQLLALQNTHSAQIQRLHAEERERYGRIELTLQGVLMLTEDLRTLANEARAKQARRRTGEPT